MKCCVIAMLPRAAGMLLAVFYCLLPLVLSGCGAANDRSGARTLPRTPIAQMSASAATALTVTPTPASRRLAIAVDVANGKVLVQAQCAWCHALTDAGIVGGQDPVAASLDGIGSLHGQAWLSAVLLDACAQGSRLASARCDQAHSTVAALTVRQREQIVRYLLTLR